MDLPPQSQRFLLQMMASIPIAFCVVGAHIVRLRMKRGQLSNRFGWALFALLFIIAGSPWPVYHFMGIIPD